MWARLKKTAAASHSWNYSQFLDQHVEPSSEQQPMTELNKVPGTWTLAGAAHSPDFTPGFLPVWCRVWAKGAWLRNGGDALGVSGNPACDVHGPSVNGWNSTLDSRLSLLSRQVIPAPCWERPTFLSDNRSPSNSFGPEGKTIVRDLIKISGMLIINCLIACLYFIASYNAFSKLLTTSKKGKIFA